jgi:NAD(P)-dependent dehydrogenase (short-subunit alcohol dehydrogenase family)
MGRLEGRVAVITGGASGIGESAVRAFVAEGARVVIADLQEDKGRALAADLPEVTWFQRTDVADEAAMTQLAMEALERFGRLDCFYNNAGFSCGNHPVADLPMAEYDAQMAVLLRGTFLGIKCAAQVMVPRRSGVIINTASVAALGGGYANHVYSAAKAGVVSLTRTTALELGEQGIRVNCICPGGILTPIFVRRLALSPDEEREALGVFAEALANNALGRCGMPADVADTAVWLACDESRFVSGQAIVVDGGLTSGKRWSEVAGWDRDLRARLYQRLPGVAARLSANSASK